MISTYIPGYPSIVRLHLEQGAVNGDIPVMIVCLVAEMGTPPEFRDDLGFITVTQMTMTAYSES